MMKVILHNFVTRYLSSEPCCYLKRKREEKRKIWLDNFQVARFFRLSQYYLKRRVPERASVPDRLFIFPSWIERSWKDDIPV